MNKIDILILPFIHGAVLMLIGVLIIKLKMTLRRTILKNKYFDRIYILLSIIESLKCPSLIEKNPRNNSKNMN